MARYEIAEVERAWLGQVYVSGDVLFELGIKYSTGRSVPADLVSAHKWFNLAAMRGKSEAIRYRREIAAELSAAEVAAAQRAARDWLARH
jgi:TPR repeat protein